MSDLAKIEEIYHAALEKPLAERAGFLAEICGDDADLRREVESLLEFDEDAEDFIESPPEDIAAAMFAKNETPVGKTLSHYRVLDVLGAGGMGEVFLAEDVKLGRKVALKLLPAQFSSDAQRKERFEREARAASALNHPNIITIYGIEKFKNQTFIVTEYIEGETLRERLIKSGAPDFKDALDIALQIASALEAAHSVGIIHRDIKPANVMLRRDGIVKVLDFGLAKLTAQTDSEAETQKLQTKSGMVMGTVAYMSPEQALGERLDARSDIFSFGVVFYEMLTGTQPFKGNSDAAVYNATLNEMPPSPREINPRIPQEFDFIVSRMLAKKRAERYQTAADLRNDLKTLQSGSSERFSSGFSFQTTKSKRFSKKMIYAVSAVSILLAAAVFYYVFFAGNFAKPAQDAVKNFNFTQFTNSGDAMLPSLSPDGKTLLFSSRQTGNWDIYFQRVGGANAINLTKDSLADDFQAVYSPDGEQIAFRSDRDGGGIFVMGATGENIRKVSDAGFYPSWSPDSKQIVFCNSYFEDPTTINLTSGGISILNLASGEKREIYGGDAYQPSWSPSGERIAFWSLSSGAIRDIKTVSASGGEAVFVTNDVALDWSPVWSHDGKYLYFASNRGGSMNFWRVALDEKTGKTLGNPEPFTTPSLYSSHLTFTKNGKTLGYVQTTNSSNIIQAEFNSKSETLDANLKEITRGGRFDRNPSVSPDGEWIVFDAIKDKQEDLFLMRRDGSNLRQLTDDLAKDRAARFSPDGKKLMFYSERSGKYEAWTINTDGSNLTQMTFNTEPAGLLAFWSPDGTKILQNVSDKEARIFDASKPLTEQTPASLAAISSPDYWLMAYHWSPDGEKLGLLVSGRTKNIFGIYTYSFSSQKYQKIADYGDSPIWLNDNRRIIFFDKNKIFLHDTQTSKTKEMLTLPQNVSLQGITVSPDNRFVYFSMEKKETNLWLATLE